MTQTEKDQTIPNGAPQAPANDPGPEAAPAEPQTGNDSGMPREELEARFAALAAELAEKSAEFAAFKDSAQRQLAEKENQRRRAENEMADARKYGAVPFARDTLALADNLRRALAAAAAPADDAAARAQMFDALRQGVELIDREFSGILERHGIKRIEPLGEKFDPNWHQAMFEAEVPGAAPGSVIQVVQPGYRLHDRLLRAAMVGVAKTKPAESQKGEAPKDETPGG